MVEFKALTFVSLVTFPDTIEFVEFTEVFVEVPLLEDTDVLLELVKFDDDVVFVVELAVSLVELAEVVSYKNLTSP